MNLTSSGETERMRAASPATLTRMPASSSGGLVFEAVIVWSVKKSSSSSSFCGRAEAIEPRAMAPALLAGCVDDDHVFLESGE